MHTIYVAKVSQTSSLFLIHSYSHYTFYILLVGNLTRNEAQHTIHSADLRWREPNLHRQSGRRQKPAGTLT